MYDSRNDNMGDDEVRGSEVSQCQTPVEWERYLPVNVNTRTVWSVSFPIYMGTDAQHQREGRPRWTPYWQSAETREGIYYTCVIPGCLGFFSPNWREGWSAKFSMGVDVEEGGKYLPCPRKDSLPNVHRVVVVRPDQLKRRMISKVLAMNRRMSTYLYPRKDAPSLCRIDQVVLLSYAPCEKNSTGECKNSCLQPNSSRSLFAFKVVLEAARTQTGGLSHLPSRFIAVPSLSDKSRITYPRSRSPGVIGSTHLVVRFIYESSFSRLDRTTSALRQCGPLMSMTRTMKEPLGEEIVSKAV
jgi:hypothetical protein